MLEPDDHKKRIIGRSESISRCVVSCTMVLLTQFALSLVPRFFSSSSLLIQLSLSVIVLLAVVGFGRLLKLILGISGSASAFVFFNILFIWCFYVLIVRQAVSLAMDFVFNGEVVMLIIGLRSMLKSDPGLVIREDSSASKPTSSLIYGFNDHDEELELSTRGLCRESTEGSVLGRRVRHCRVCKAYIKGFDHHCPALGNCIGQKNYLVFMVLLIGFFVIEASYLACTCEYIAKFGISSTRINSETSLSQNLALSTRMFLILQLAWQVVFFAWHIYCICFNIRTDEWINWKKYSEFQLIVQSQPGQGYTETRFTNPYDKGILHNVKEFLH